MESRQYSPATVEAKWQERWRRAGVWTGAKDALRPKYYLLEMFPYLSGRLHMGHVRNYTIGDVIARWRQAEGFNVLHPMGWDAFGLPAENAAIKNGSHPEKWALETIQVMKRQLQRLGLGYDWSREIVTCLPEYYRWEQLFFVELFKKGLAYRKSAEVSWCSECRTALAQEQVNEGRCWQCDCETTTREQEQWFLKITSYAQELFEGLEYLDGWPEPVLTMQRNWIGRSGGAEIDFVIEGGGGKNLSTFTARPETLFGVTFLAIAPEHPLMEDLCHGKAQEQEVRAFVSKCRKEEKKSRVAEDAPKEGVFTGTHAIHPLTGAPIPVYVASFVLPEPGTGVLMGVPAHDSSDYVFARKYALPVIEVIAPPPEDVKAFRPSADSAYVEPGVMKASGKFDGMSSEQAKGAIVQELERSGKGRYAVTYRLRDWGVSRQRYWGTPIPIIYCHKCGTVPVPEKDLPVMLPLDVELTGTEGSPLAAYPSFQKTTCPGCGAPDARRDSETLDVFMESAWYYLRYLSPKEAQRPFDPEELSYWLGGDLYIGGVEHAAMHLLYFRFFHKVLRDLGYLPESLCARDLNEPVRSLLNQGSVCKDDVKMSKAKGNVVEPDAMIDSYGADAVRLFLMFAAPPEKVLEWSEQGVEGAYRFLGRVWRMVEAHEGVLNGIEPYSASHSELANDAAKALRLKTHQTIARVTRDFGEGYHLNTAIAAIMELVNEIYTYPLELGVTESRAVLREAIEVVLKLLNPFAPHITEELWERLGYAQSLGLQGVPKVDQEALVKDVVTVVVQVNGKLRGSIEVGTGLSQEQVVGLAQADPKVSPHLSGKQIMKTVFVPGKLVNFVVNE